MSSGVYICCFADLLAQGYRPPLVIEETELLGIRLGILVVILVKCLGQFLLED